MSSKSEVGQYQFRQEIGPRRTFGSGLYCCFGPSLYPPGGLFTVRIQDVAIK